VQQYKTGNCKIYHFDEMWLRRSYYIKNVGRYNTADKVVGFL